MTTTLPVVAPAGTGTTMLVADQVVGVAAVPLKVTVLVPWVAPKLVPVIVTDVADRAARRRQAREASARTVTVKVTPLLARPPTVTTTLPVVAPAGTGTTMLVADQVVGVAVVPLKVTVLVPLRRAEVACRVIVTAVATGPLVGDRLVSVGGTVTVKVSAVARHAADGDDDVAGRRAGRHGDDDAASPTRSSASRWCR